MTTTKRLLIRASNSYDTDLVVPVNTNIPLEIDSAIGKFKLLIIVKNFDGSKPHLANSLYNTGEKTYLNGEPIGPEVSDVDDLTKSLNPNLRVEVHFEPKEPINGSELIFGNDLSVPIKDYVPTTLLSTGLKFFSWFVNKTMRADIYSDKPFIYGLALNSFTYLSVNKSDDNELTQQLSPSKKPPAVPFTNFKENLNENPDNILNIPESSTERVRYFLSLDKCKEFTFNKDTSYILQFDTNFIKMADSHYAVSIPTFGNRTFDIDVSSYANDKLNNFNWTIKLNGIDEVDTGTLGLVINFALLEEEDN
ncbi:uncharacterized protein RJT20DRAFT_10583 [Scheffersomyces xylosifermentans]|uniref:uncharacterized protein n=1 Tax=Scheffersomyces xylosifermentans TaxID=1304137 RepID=UPI00315D1EC9